MIGDYRQREAIFYPWAYWDDLFSDDDLARIIAVAAELPQKRATVGRSAEEERCDEQVRRSNLAFIHRDPDKEWIFRRLMQASDLINERYYMYRLDGFDQIQYGEYRADDSGMYGWHMDRHMGINVHEDGGHRRLSLSLLLNEPGKDFEGGEFEYTTDVVNAQRMEQKKGRVIAFDSMLIHRVQPVTKGVRLSAVTWCIGQK